MKPSEEAEIAKKAQKDKKYFDYFYRTYYQDILRYVHGFVKDKETAEDMASITFEKALKGIDTFQWEGVSVKSWLYRIARNTLYDYFRKKNVREPAISLQQSFSRDDESGTTLEDSVADNVLSIELQIIVSEEEKQLYEIFRQFDEQDQFLLYYKYFEDMSNKQIANLVGLSETNVGTRLQRLREKLKKQLQQV